MAEKRQMFRWHLCHDIDLLKEVTAIRPKGPRDWTTIAVNLDNAWPDDPNRVLKERSCREHFDLLLKHHKQGNASALKKSGTAEEYGELQQLLDDALAFVEDTIREKEQNKKTKKEESDREKGIKIRDEAMATYKRRSLSGDGSESDNSDSDSGSSKKKVTKRTKRPDVLSFLKEKNEGLVDFREQELRYKERALEAETRLKQEALEVEKKKIEVQEKQINMQLELMKALLDKNK